LLGRAAHRRPPLQGSFRLRQQDRDLSS
jgi:hypothetical protein